MILTFHSGKETTAWACELIVTERLTFGQRRKRAIIKNAASLTRGINPGGETITAVIVAPNIATVEGVGVLVMRARSRRYLSG
jgi:hypothetical protein